MKPRIYITGPYTRPDPCENTGKMMKVWDELLTLGFWPVCPLWSHFQHTFYPRPYKDWLDYDLEGIDIFDALLRIPGESSGAEKEIARAVELGIPVAYSIPELLGLFNMKQSCEVS